MMPIEVILHINDYCVGTLSFVLNLTLLIAIIAHSNSSNYGAYRVVLGFTAACDAFYSFFVICTQMAYVISDNNILLVAMGPVKYLGSTMTDIFLQIYCYMTVITYMIVPSIYVYRYFIIVKKIPPYQHRLFSLIVLFALVICVVPAFTTLYLIRPAEEDYEEAIPKVNRVFGADAIHQRVLIGGNIETNFFVLLACSTIGIEIVLAYLTAFLCARAVVKHLRQQQTQILKKTRDMQRNISWLLAIQAIAPFFFCAVPVLVVIVNTVRGSDMGALSVLLSASFTWVPTANALVSFYFLKPYRQWILSRTLIYTAKPVIVHRTSTVRATECATDLGPHQLTVKLVRVKVDLLVANFLGHVLTPDDREQLKERCPSSIGGLQCHLWNAERQLVWSLNV